MNISCHVVVNMLIDFSSFIKDDNYFQLFSEIILLESSKRRIHWATTNIFNNLHILGQNNTSMQQSKCSVELCHTAYCQTKLTKATEIITFREVIGHLILKDDEF